MPPKPSPSATRHAQRVRCYVCAKRADANASACPSCSAGFRALCACGAEISTFAERCGACGAAHVPTRLPRARHPAVRAVRWTAIAAAAAAALWVAFGRRPEPAWRLLAEAGDALQAGDYATAFRLSRSVTEQAPGSARGWCVLSTSLRKLGMPADSYVPPAERAALLAPGMFEPRNVLALHALDTGRTGLALEHALAAARAPGADARASLLLARVELAQPRPDFARARDALDRARSGGRTDPDASVLLAEIVLRTWGITACRDSRLPPALRRVLSDAAGDAAAKAPPGSRSALGAARARILLALGSLDESLAIAEAAIAALPADATPRERSEIELTHAMALQVEGRIAAAAEEFGRAIRRTPDAATAGLIASFFEESSDLAGAEAILSNAAQSPDPFGAVHALLARVQFSAGRLPQADASIAAARAADAANAGFAAIEAEIRLRQGRWQDARDCLAEAARLAPRLVAPRVDLARVEVDRPGSREEREKALRDATAELESLRVETGDDPVVLRALAELKFARGEAEAAIALLQRSSAAAPWDAETWRVLGEVLLAPPASHRADDGPDETMRRAASAFAEAAALRPSHAALRLREADAWILAGEPASALAALDQCAPPDRGREDVLRRRAIASMQLGDWRGAAADLARVRAAAPNDPAVLVNLAEALLCAGDAAAARRLIAGAAPSQPDDVRRTLEFIEAVHAGPADDAFAALAASAPSAAAAELLLAGGRVGDAVRMLRAALAASPGDPVASRLLVLALLDGETATGDVLVEARAVAAALPESTPPAVRELIAGRILLASGDPREAASRFAAAQAADGTDPYAAMLRGEALFRTGDRGESLRSMRCAIALPGAPASFRRIAASRVLAASTESDDGARRLRLAEEAFRIEPGLTATGVHLGGLLSARGEFGRAADVLERTLRQAGVPAEDRAPMLFTAAMQRFLNTEPRRARALLDELPPGARDASASRLLAGYVALQEGRHADADAEFAAALASDPDSAAAAAARVDVSLALGRLDEARRRVDEGALARDRSGWFLARAARLFLRDGHAEDAVVYARRAADAAPGDGPVLASTAAVLARTGHAGDAVARLLGRAADAQSDASAAVAARLLAGRLMARIPGRAREALDLARAIGDDASAPAGARREALLLEAEAQLCADDVAGAVKTARPLLFTISDGGPSSEEERRFAQRLWHALGTALSSTDGAGAEAMQFLSKAFEIDPDDEATANNLAWLLSRSPGTAARGLELARRATAADPDRPAYWDTRAACAVAAGAPDEASASWRTSIELIDASPSPDLALRAQCGLGIARILIASSRADGARALLERVTRDAPGSPAAIEAARLLGR